MACICRSALALTCAACLRNSACGEQRIYSHPQQALQTRRMMAQWLTREIVCLCAIFRDGLGELPLLCIILGLQLIPADTHTARPLAVRRCLALSVRAVHMQHADEKQIWDGGDG